MPYFPNYFIFAEKIISAEKNKNNTIPAKAGISAPQGAYFRKIRAQSIALARDEIPAFAGMVYSYISASCRNLLRHAPREEISRRLPEKSIVIPAKAGISAANAAQGVGERIALSGDEIPACAGITAIFPPELANFGRIRKIVIIRAGG